MAAEVRFRAMGTDCHLVVVGGPDSAVGTARSRIVDLEERWSRFIPTSEVSVLNASPGTPMVVSDDTLLLVERAMEANRVTGGVFDPTVLGDMIRAGYDRSFDQLPDDPHAESDLLRGSIGVMGSTVTLSPGTGFDPGGIGKGLAADLVAQEAMAAGADGVLVNLGGDVRVEGISPEGDGWEISIEHPDRQLTTVGLASGAVATSTRLLRRWAVRGETRHHLIDPSTGRPSDSDLALVTVVAATAWRAEVFAKACLIAGSFDPMDGTGLEALAVTDEGNALSTPGMERFTDNIPTPGVLT